MPNFRNKSTKDFVYGKNLKTSKIIVGKIIAVFTDSIFVQFEDGTIKNFWRDTGKCISLPNTHILKGSVVGRL